MTETRLLKKDLFGEVSRGLCGADACIVRDTGAAAVWVRWFARLLLRREARALAALDGLAGVPRLIDVSRDRLVRSYIPGAPMHEARPSDPEYFLRAGRLLRRLHRAGVVHNDLAKEPNLLVCDDGTPAFIDFQLAWYARDHGRLFRLLGHEDLRHLLKHKRSYCADLLTQRERRILENPSLVSRVWMRTVKPVYLFTTRRLLGWADREGAGNRGDQ